MAALLTSAVFVACSPTGEQAQANASAVSSKSQTASSGPYAIERVEGVDVTTLPTNSDFLMLDRDLERYASTLCEVDQPANAPQRCDVYAQADPAGTLVGYVAVKQIHDGVWLNSALTLGNTARGRVPCFIGGKLTSSETYEAMTPAEATRDFRARTGYAAWERSPGDWMISPDDGEDELDSNPNSARGTWYLERSGNNLRIQQERWNYCYPDTSVHIDDVYRRVISLIKKPT